MESDHSTNRRTPWNSTYLKDRAQQHAERLGVGERAAPIGAGNVLLEQGLQAHALEEVVDQG